MKFHYREKQGPFWKRIKAVKNDYLRMNMEAIALALATQEIRAIRALAETEKIDRKVGKRTLDPAKDLPLKNSTPRKS